MARKKTDISPEAEGAMLNLRAFYLENRRKAREVKSRVREKYREVIEQEIAREQQAVDYEFARSLAEVKERFDIPVTRLMDEVLRSRSWDRWEKWRDLAGIPDEMTRLQGAKDAEREARKPYRVENGRVIVTRNESGPVEEFPVASVNRGADGETYVFWGPLVPGEEGYEAFLAAFGKDVNRLSRFLNAAFGEYNETPEEYEEGD